MTVIVDIGNTRLKWALYCDGKIKDVNFALVSEVDHVWFEQQFVASSTIVVASVNNDELLKDLEKWSLDNEIKFYHVTTEHRFGEITNGYQDYTRLGVDRWLAVVAAHSIYTDRYCVIIDSGSATTVDVVTCEGKHLGGWILPGVDMMVNSVLTTTAQVRGEQVTIEQLGFGINTSENLSYASWAASKGLVTEAVAQAEKQLGTNIKLIFTGGNGKRLCQLYGQGMYIEHLVIQGLAKYADVLS